MSNLVEYLSSRISHYLGESVVIKDCDELFVCREDGVLLFKEITDETRAESLGALVAGMWQAAKSVQGSDKDLREYGFSLQLATSEEGIFVFPLLLDQQSLILTVVFKDELHPARLKNRCRMLRDNIENDFVEISRTKASPLEDKQEKFLFTNISDTEIDNLFSFAGI